MGRHLHGSIQIILLDDGQIRAWPWVHCLLQGNYRLL